MNAANMNVCGYNYNGIRIAVIYRYQENWCIANHGRGGYPYYFASVADAKAYVALTTLNVAEWREEVVEPL